MAKGLTEKQKRFAEHFAASGNITASARAAGYGGNDATVHQTGRDTLENPRVAELIAKLRPETPDVADRAERQAFLTSVMRGQVVEETRDPLMARVKACELLGKMGGDYVQRVEHSGLNGNPIEVAAEQAAGVRSLLSNEEAREKLFGALEALSAGVGSGTA